MLKPLWKPILLPDSFDFDHDMSSGMSAVSAPCTSDLVTSPRCLAHSKALSAMVLMGNNLGPEPGKLLDS